MYSINKDFTDFISNNFDITEVQQRRSVIERVHLLLSEESPGIRNSVINILFELPSEERRPFLDQIFELVTDDTSDEEKEELIKSLSEISQEERQAIIDVANRLIIEDLESEYQLYIVMILSKVSQEERKSILDESRLLFIHCLPDEYKPLMIDSLAKLNPNERKTLVEQTLRLFNNALSPRNMARTFRLIGTLPIPNRSLLITAALRVITDVMSAEDREEIIEFLTRLPSEEIDCLTRQADRLITKDMSCLDRLRIINFLSELPLHELEFLITQVLRLSDSRRSANDSIYLSTLLSRIPIEEMESLITESLTLITADMNCRNKEDVIFYLNSLTKNDREFLIKQVLHLNNHKDVTSVSRVITIAFVYRTISNYIFVVPTIEAITENPIKILLDLYKKLEEQDIGLIPSSIEYTENSEVIDDGGVTRSFITKLMESLCNSNCNLITKSEIGVIPIFDESSSLSVENQEQCFKIIGRFFSCALQKYKSIVLGPYFHPIIFEMIFTLNNQDFINYNSSQVFDKMLKTCILRELNGSEEFAEAVTQDNITDELRDIYYINSKEQCIQEYVFDKKIKAVLIIAKSIYDSLSNKIDWNVLKGNSAVILREKIEGSISKARVKSALQSDERDPVDENSLEFMEKWLTGTNSAQLERFVQAISGMKTLSSMTKLHVANMPGLNKLPQFHTCFFRMDLSAYSSYEAFKEKLEISLDHCLLDSGFQMA